MIFEFIIVIYFYCPNFEANDEKLLIHFDPDTFSTELRQIPFYFEKDKYAQRILFKKLWDQLDWRQYQCVIIWANSQGLKQKHESMAVADSRGGKVKTVGDSPFVNPYWTCTLEPMLYFVSF